MNAPSGSSLLPDLGQISQFVDLLFRYADDGTYASLRTFFQSQRGVAPYDIRATLIEPSLERLKTDAARAAQHGSKSPMPTVFAPPVATFTNPSRARGIDLANGLALSVEIDDHPALSRSRLVQLLGPATVIVESGSCWTDPATGEMQPRLHLHWRLSEATRDQTEHDQLTIARSLATELIGADPTGIPTVHPLRWPGSWNLKGTPRLARIVEHHDDAEIHLGEALAELEDIVGRQSANAAAACQADAETDPKLIASAMEQIPNANADVHYGDWIRLGYATWRASGGSQQGFEIWNHWSQKSLKYDADQTVAAWKRIGAAISGTGPSRPITARTIFHLATRNGWTRPGATNDLPLSPVDAIVKRFNERYFVVNEAGRTTIFQPTFDPTLKRRLYHRLTFRDLQQLYMNDQVQVGTDGNGKPVFKTSAIAWLTHPDRRQFTDGVTFDPTGNNAPGVLNLWEGYAVKPRPGNWSLLRAHIETVICAGDSVRSDYLFKWIARMLQHPDEPGEVAIVLKGGEGTGKGTLAKVIKQIVGHHSLAISNARHLVGNFNAHLRDCIFLFADEAFFAGDRAHVGVLKALITEPTLTLEAKYANAVEVPNFLHVMMASNEEWVVPAGSDARRFFVLVLSEEMKGNHGYFGAIWDQMEAGGYEAMLHDMLAMDLRTFNVRAVPTTEGLQHQRKLSLPTTESWWLDCLERGYVFRSKLGLEAEFAQWRATISTELLFASYLDFAKLRGERRRLTREGIGRFFAKLRAPSRRWRNGVVGEHITDVKNLYGGTTRTAEAIKRDRLHGYCVGSLSDARAAFVELTGTPVVWDGGTAEVDEHDVRELEPVA